MDTADLVADEDLMAAGAAPEAGQAGRQAASQLVEELAGGAMSARERNRLKRKVHPLQTHLADYRDFWKWAHLYMHRGTLVHTCSSSESCPAANMALCAPV